MKSIKEFIKLECLPAAITNPLLYFEYLKIFLSFQPLQDSFDQFYHEF